MVRICWSQDSSTSMESDSFDLEGDWACHQFIIVSESVFNEMPDRASWENISRSVYSALNDIWKGEDLPCCEIEEDEISEENEDEYILVLGPPKVFTI